MTGALFDLDGTLLDLPVDIAEVRKQVAARFAQRGYRGSFTPLLPKIASAADLVARDPEDRQQLLHQADQIIVEAEVHAAARAAARAGAAEAVAALHARGWPLGVVTDNGRRCVAPALAAAGIDAIFAAIVSRDDVARPKPMPDGVIACATALMPDGGTLFLVGDSPRDILAGRAARILLPEIELITVAVTSGRGEPVDLVAAGPDITIQNLAEFLTAIEARPGPGLGPGRVQV